jgi:protein dithiol oxidoreductase (disulfide-forming)
MSTQSSLTRRAFAGVLLAVAAGLLAPGAGAQGLQEGKNYFRLKSPQPVETGKKIEVIEFFSYGCPHCADLDPELQAWQKTLPADVAFRRVPVMFQDRWIGLAKVFFTLEALGVDDRMTPEVFVAVHKSGMPLWNEKTFFDWAASRGLDRKKVEEMYTSFAINGKVNRAKQLAQAYNVQSVPMVIVDGKFTTASDKVGTHAAMPAAINELIAKARAERPKS